MPRWWKVEQFDDKTLDKLDEKDKISINLHATKAHIRVRQQNKLRISNKH